MRIKDQITRRSALLGAASVALAAPALTPSIGRAAGSVIKVNFARQAGFNLASLTAFERGFYREEGLDVTFVPLDSGPAAIAAAQAGSVDLFFSDIFAWISALANGYAGFQLIQSAGIGSAAFIARPDSGIDGPQDLVGKKVGVRAAPAYTVATKVWLARAGVDTSKVQFIITPPLTTAQSIKSGDLDAGIVGDPELSQAALSWNAKIIGNGFAEALPHGASQVAYFASAGFIAKHGQEGINRVARALRKGAKYWAAASQTERATLTGPYSGIDLKTLEAQSPGIVGRLTYGEVEPYVFDIRATEAWIASAFEHKGIPRIVDIAPYVNRAATQT